MARILPIRRNLKRARIRAQKRLRIKPPKNQPLGSRRDRAVLYALLALGVLGFLLGSRSVAAVNDKPEPATSESIERGEYLVTILGCGGCHTEGALEGHPYGKSLGGSRIGIAYTDTSESDLPGIVFPSNLSSHQHHGLGKWSRDDIARAIRSGINHRGGEVITVMPWINYSLLSSSDTYDIVDYLRSLPAIDYPIPTPVPLGEPTTNKYLRIGVYTFQPNTNVEPMRAQSLPDLAK